MQQKPKHLKQLMHNTIIDINAGGVPYVDVPTDLKLDVKVVKNRLHIRGDKQAFECLAKVLLLQALMPRDENLRTYHTHIDLADGYISEIIVGLVDFK